PAAKLGGWTRVRDIEEAFLVLLGVEIDTVPDATEQRTTHVVLSDPIAQVKHGVRFTPVFTIFPDHDWCAAHLLRKIHQLRIGGLASVRKKDLVVLRNQLPLQLVKMRVDLRRSNHVTKLVRNIRRRERVAANRYIRLSRHK